MASTQKYVDGRLVNESFVDLTDVRFYHQPIVQGGVSSGGGVMWQQGWAEMSPVGLFGYAICQALLGSILCDWYGAEGKYMFSMAFFIGGGAQFFAGVMELMQGKKVGGTIFVMFGLFYFSFSMNLLKDFLIMLLDSTVNHGVRQYSEEGFVNMNAFYAALYAGFALIGAVGLCRTTVMHVILLSLTCLDFALVSAADWCEDKKKIRLAAGYTIIISAAVGFYVGAAELLAKETPINLPLFHLRPQKGRAQRAPSAGQATGEAM